ncbi:prolyl oligopeptidase family serine peptidase [Paenibacillus sp. JNUCC31]|uniref:alpha/beta hydrolase family protein n=1 Tax=Paenibacillus sp. JNUCC-31 TaxID=2777983 RepID=UPI00177EE0B2|nr:prolyl oligopeptidase family serine peptidase [Paenibacillus sp. JNUCC-31]QOS81191.1 prolyl oligopeptidase family serine peptidase [Paenibacillus sp. JNUCC-31]
MRILEWMLVLVSLAIALFMWVAPRNRTSTIGSLMALVLAVLLHGLIDHFRVQMLTTYIVASLLFIVGIVRYVKLSRRGGYVRDTHLNMNKQIPRYRSWKKAALASIPVLALSAGTIVLTSYFPAFTMPEPTGSYAIGTFSQQLTDDSREETKSAEVGDKRELMINVWYPVDQDTAKGMPVDHYPAELGEAISLVFGIPPMVFSYLDTIPTHVVQGAEVSAAQSKYPVLLFSPGVRSARFQSMTAIEELVSHGYIVVGIDHPYTSALVTFPDGHAVSYEADPEFATSAELYEYNIKGVGVRAEDASFVLDTLTQWNSHDPKGLLEGKLDLDRVGIFGHSYGGATTTEALAQDDRFKAGLSLEGGFWGTVSTTAMKQPFMYIMSGGTAKSLDPNATSKDKVFYPEFEPDLDRVMTSSLNDTYYLTVDGFFHQSFTDISLISPQLFAKGMTPEHNVDITRSYTLAFFDRYLKGEEEQPLLEGPSARFPEATYDTKYTKLRGNQAK